MKRMIGGDEMVITGGKNDDSREIQNLKKAISYAEKKGWWN